MSAAGQAASTGTFTPGPGAAIVSDDLTTALEAGHEEVGWLAQKGRVPLGYLGDADKTARTFPVIDGTRYSVPGDRARLTADGVIELYGRDSVTINSGGEKIFAEEVEQAIAHHPDVYDVVCAGRPSERWGQEVVAVVQLREGADRHRGGPARRGRHPRGPLQAAEGVPLPRRDRALTGRQGRLPLGQGAGRAGRSRVIRSTSRCGFDDDAMAHRRTVSLAKEGRTHMLNRSGDDLGIIETPVAAPRAA